MIYKSWIFRSGSNLGKINRSQGKKESSISNMLTHANHNQLKINNEFVRDNNKADETKKDNEIFISSNDNHCY